MRLDLLQFTVNVRDLGVPLPKTGTPATVTITVIRNTFPPTFLGEPYSKTLLETAPVGTSIFQVAAEDKDSRVRSTISSICSSDSVYSNLI